MIREKVVLEVLISLSSFSSKLTIFALNLMRGELIKMLSRAW